MSLQLISSSRYYQPTQHYHGHQFEQRVTIAKNYHRTPTNDTLLIETILKKPNLPEQAAQFGCHRSGHRIVTSTGRASKN